MSMHCPNQIFQRKKMNHPKAKPYFIIIRESSISILFLSLPSEWSKVFGSGQTEILNLVTMFYFVGMAPLFMRNFQPKVLFILATLLTAFAMIVIGIFIFLQEFYPNLPYLDMVSWIPLITGNYFLFFEKSFLCSQNIFTLLFN